MVRVYLDQAKWIDLGRAMHGRADGERFRAAFDVARESVAVGFVSFPLSTGHYIETWRAGDPACRRRLAETMIALSRGHTMARPPDLCDKELDALLARVTGVAPRRATWPVFGFGFGHAAGLTADLGEQDIDLAIETEQLAVRPAGFEAHGRGHREFGELYSAGETQLAQGGRERDDGREQHEAVVAGSAVMEIHENIAWALERAGLDRDALGPIGHVRPDLPPERVTAVSTSCCRSRAASSASCRRATPRCSCG